LSSIDWFSGQLICDKKHGKNYAICKRLSFKATHLGLGIHIPSTNQWEFQDPKLEVLYHIRPYFVGIFPEIYA
jgi:hypothetical protein